MKTAFLSALAIVLFATANAQESSNVPQLVTLNLSNKIDISVVSGSATGTNFTFASTTDYADGLTNSNASQFQVRSNKEFTVTVKAATANFNTASATPMPSTVLGVKLSSGSTFQELSTTAATLTSGLRGIKTFTVDYQAKPGFSYDAGTYELSVVYTATQQ